VVGELAVVVLEVGPHVRLDLLTRHRRRVERRVLDRPPGDEEGDDDVQGQGPEPPPSEPVERGGKRQQEECSDVGPGRGVSPSQRDPGAAEDRRQVADEARVRLTGADQREVRRHLLVEIQQLVRLVPRQPAPPAELIEAAPLGGVRGDECVEVHAVTI
jgi:hypothetical protein